MMERWYVDTMTETKSYETIAANVAAVREHMRQAALAAGRNPEDITLVAATKVQTSDTIRNAIRAGITICGENRSRNSPPTWRTMPTRGPGSTSSGTCRPTR